MTLAFDFKTFDLCVAATSSSRRTFVFFYTFFISFARDNIYLLLRCHSLRMSACFHSPQHHRDAPAPSTHVVNEPRRRNFTLSPFDPCGYAFNSKLLFNISYCSALTTGFLKNEPAVPTLVRAFLVRMNTIASRISLSVGTTTPLSSKYFLTSS